MTSLAFDPAMLSPKLRLAYEALPETDRQLIASKVNRDRGYVPPNISLELLVALSHLSEREREVWVDSEIVGRTMREIASGLELSHQRVSQVKRTAREKLTRRYRAWQLRFDYVASHPDVKARAAGQPSPGR